MAKVQIKSEKLTPFGGIFSIMEQFDALLAQTIDSTLGLRCTLFGYQYSEILRSLMCVYFCDGKERIFDDMINGFGWNRLPKSFMAQNTVFLLMTALIRNFYKAIMQRLRPHDLGLRVTSRIKTFVFKFITVPAKWVKTMRRHILNIYIDSYAYANLFQTKQTLVKVKDRAFLVEPAYYLKPLYRVRGWVCDVSFLQGICTIKRFL